MYIYKIELSNFQCFGKVPTTIRLEKDITCLIGNNGSGKSAIIRAIQRIFGNTVEERTVIKSDFHICPNETDEDIKGRQLYIDIVFGFENKDETEMLAFFSPVIYEDKKHQFFARIRLEAVWNEEEYEDDVSSTLFWVLGDEDIEFGNISPLKIKVENHERRQISLIYIPAVRDTKSILRDDMRRIIKKIERYADISDDKKLAIETGSEILREKISDLPIIKSIQSMINETWQKTHDGSLQHYNNVKLEAVASKFDDLIKSLLLKLCPAETAEAKNINELSDGQISLLYFSLSMALYELEIKHSKRKLEGVKEQDYEASIFTILAVEEPENHLSAFYLSRIMSLFEGKNTNKNIISIITSHSPNVVRRMKRVEQIRFLRQELSDDERKSLIYNVLLPENKTDDDYKYINQAVLAHPELYFAKFVVLGEGDSEEIVLPTVAQKSGYNFDSSFVSFVQLGGRHVNYMWRLLDELKIPHLTLLDYDRGRKNGGASRVDYIIKQLEKLGKCTTVDFNELSIDEKRKKLRNDYKVFFSYPLDLDMMMIESFPQYYMDNGNNDSHENLVIAVLGKDGCEDEYNGNFFSDDLLKKYRYLFKSKSKVAAHYLACDKIKSMENKDFFDNIPPVLDMIIDTIREVLCIPESKQKLDYIVLSEKNNDELYSEK